MTMTLSDKREKIEDNIKKYIESKSNNSIIEGNLKKQIDSFRVEALNEGELPPIIDKWTNEMKKKLDGY
jgi:hypothetical protein